MADDKERAENRAEARFETICGVILALFAAILAWSDMQAGNVAEDRALAANDQVSTYSWYQSKSIKQNLAENTHELLTALSAADAFSASQSMLELKLKDMQTDIDRYGKEKTEILKGSSIVGEENWTQDMDGQMGVITGADQYKERVDSLGAIDNTFDSAGLFLQLCLVLGALSLVFKQPLPRYGFLLAMIAVGFVGIIYTAQGFLAYQAVLQPPA
jgi:hypothetical protein